MEPAGDKKNEKARRRLLKEGARSYLDAVSALIAYQKGGAKDMQGGPEKSPR